MSPLAWFDFRLSQITLRPATCEIENRGCAKFVEGNSGGARYAMAISGGAGWPVQRPRGAKRG